MEQQHMISVSRLVGLLSGRVDDVVKRLSDGEIEYSEYFNRLNELKDQAREVHSWAVASYHSMIDTLLFKIERSISKVKMPSR